MLLTELCRMKFYLEGDSVDQVPNSYSSIRILLLLCCKIETASY